MDDDDGLVTCRKRGGEEVIKRRERKKECRRGARCAAAPGAATAVPACKQAHSPVRARWPPLGPPCWSLPRSAVPPNRARLPLPDRPVCDLLRRSSASMLFVADLRRRSSSILPPVFHPRLPRRGPLLSRPPRRRRRPRRQRSPVPRRTARGRRGRGTYRRDTSCHVMPRHVAPSRGRRGRGTSR